MFEPGLRPVRPSPHAHFLPVSVVPTRVTSGAPAWPPRLLPWAVGVAFWDELNRVMDGGSQFSQKKRTAFQLLYLPFRSLFSLVFHLFLSSSPFLGAGGSRQCPVSGQGACSRRLHGRVEVWRAEISQVPRRDSDVGALSRERPGLSHSPYYPTCAYFTYLLLTRIS